MTPTPKEKAIELVNKFKRYADKNAIPSTLTLSGGSGGITFNFKDLIESAKQCALIAVDEIINSKPSFNFWDSSVGSERRSNIEYWIDVKSEINNL